jgi:hypothetical protein
LDAALFLVSSILPEEMRISQPEILRVLNNGSAVGPELTGQGGVKYEELVESQADSKE